MESRAWEIYLYAGVCVCECLLHKQILLMVMGMIETMEEFGDPTQPVQQVQGQGKSTQLRRRLLVGLVVA